MVGFSLRSSLQGTVTPTPTPSPTPTPLVTTTVTGTVTPTATTDPDAYDGWSTYVLSDCNIRIKVPSDWYPGKRGDLGACGSFRTIPNTGFDTFDDYEGTLVIFAPFLDDSESESVLAFPQEDYNAYLDRVETDPVKAGDSKDLLIGDVRESLLIDKPTKRATIRRVATGTSEHIFYGLFGREFVIMSGGTTLAENQETIDLMLASIQFIEPIQGR